ncbi:MAG: hypothetical protein QOG75_4940 [Mycobacterium sp.]|nr:hypothetical protein [Mycobacterium sp.]
MGDPPADIVEVARGEMHADARFWYQSSDVVRAALLEAGRLPLGGFEFGKIAVDKGMLDSYNGILQYVLDRLSEGVDATETIGRALDAALETYDRTDHGAAGRIEQVPRTDAERPHGR